jgi:hypothetical protein
MNKVIYGSLIFIIGLGLGYIIPKQSTAKPQDEMMWAQSSQFGVMLSYVMMPGEDKESFNQNFNKFLQKQSDLFINYSKQTEDAALSNWLDKKAESVDEYLSIQKQVKPTSEVSGHFRPYSILA